MFIGSVFWGQLGEYSSNPVELYLHTGLSVLVRVDVGRKLEAVLVSIS